MLPVKVFKDNDYPHYSESVKKEFNEKHLKKNIVKLTSHMESKVSEPI